MRNLLDKAMLDKQYADPMLLQPGFPNSLQFPFPYLSLSPNVVVNLLQVQPNSLSSLPKFIPFLSLNYLLTVYKVRHQNSPLLSFHSPLGFENLPGCLGTT